MAYYGQRYSALETHSWDAKSSRSNGNDLYRYFTERLNRPLISRDMQVLRGDLDINKLTIFDTYARRVRNCTISVIPLIESTTRVQLLRLKSGLLPMLTSLVLSGRQLLCFKNEFSAFVPLILQSRSLSSITYLSIACDDPDNDHPLGDFLLTLVENINVVALRRLALLGTLQRQYVSSLSYFTHLQSVSLTWLGTSCYEVIDILSRLQLIDVRLGFAAAIPIPDKCIVSNPFPVITKLWLLGEDWPMIYILNAITGNYLESISIEEYDYSTTHNAPDNHSQIYQDFARFPSLRTIDYVLDGCEPGLISQPISSISVVQPLLGLRFLESLTLHFIQPWFRVSDDDISELAFACPSLKNLTLHPRLTPGTVGVGWPTFASLIRLATTCSHLTTLTISIDVQNLPSELPPISISHGLQKLDLAATHTDHPIALARLLHELFPLLEDVQGESDGLQEVRQFLITGT